MPDRSRAPTILGLVVVGVGLVPIAGAVFADDSGFHAPRWLVALVGVMFVLAGLMIMRGPAADGNPPNDLAQSLLGALILSAFAAIAGWLLLFTSPGEWQSSGSLPLNWLPGVVQTLFFYALLGGVTLLLVWMALVTWRDVSRRLALRVPAPLGGALPWVAGALLLGLGAWEGYRLFAPASGPRHPSVHLAFDGDLQDGGSAGARPEIHGDEVRFEPGVLGQAVFVGGSEDWLDYALPEGLDLGGSLSLALWVKREDWVNPYRPGSGVQTLVAVGPLSLSLNISRTAEAADHRFWLRAHAGRVSVTDRSRSLPPGTWTHVAAVYDRAWFALRLYVDGQPVGRGSVPIPPAPGPQRVLRIGTWHRANQAFRGAVDELRLYTHALTEDEIRASAARRR